MEGCKQTITELKTVLKSFEQKGNDRSSEINNLKSYITDLKGMIKMLLNPEGIPGLDKAQVGEIALTSMDQYLDQYAKT